MEESISMSPDLHQENRNTTANEQNTEKSSTNNKDPQKLIQQVFHKAMFVPRPRANSLGAHLPTGEPRASTSSSSSSSTRQANTMPWQNDQVPNAKRKRMESSPDYNTNDTKVTKSNIPTANSFEILEVNESPDPTSAQESLFIPKPEPIFVTGVTDVIKLKESLHQMLQDVSKYKLTTLRSGHIIKIIPADVETYKIIRNNFISMNVSHYTYQLKHEKPYRVIIRGIHASEDVNNIKMELESLGHTVRSVTNALHRQTKEPLPLYYVNLEPKPNNKDVYNIKHLINMIVKVEAPYKKKEVVQCKRCQRFGHTKNMCNRTFRCVKCGNDHPTTTCTKSRDTPAFCINCEGSHPASYKGCTKYNEYKNQIYKKSNPKPNTQNNIKEQSAEPTSIVDKNLIQMRYSHPTSTQTYANVAARSNAGSSATFPQTQQSPTETSDTAKIMEAMFSRFERTLEKMLDKIMDRMIHLVTTVINSK